MALALAAVSWTVEEPVCAGGAPGCAQTGRLLSIPAATAMAGPQPRLRIIEKPISLL
jgi:hypothetical protein